MTFSHDLAFRPAPSDDTTEQFFHHSSAQRVSTDTVIVEALKRQYPQLELTIAPAGICNLLNYAAAGYAKATPLEDPKSPFTSSLKWRQYIPPARRIDQQPGIIAEQVLFGKYMYAWKEHEFVLYVVNGRDGTQYYPQIVNNYILSSAEKHVLDGLIMEASRWSIELHNEVWVFDGGYWQKSAELWQSVQQSEWKDVILDEDMKQSIIEDADNFFNSRDTYMNLKVPWKRGIIYYGPPGNGKTISIKAMMHALSQRDDHIPTLFVRTLASFSPPEYSLRAIFTKARQEAPCYLVFEDLDSIVSDRVRSYFLNEVDGLKRNDGILMVGSTNHLDRLDPGIAKRPSRFDRKYFFPNPSLSQRTTYCHYWQSKLASNPSISFPDKLCPAIAGITDGFSFAYIQEAFVASLLTIATHKDDAIDNKVEVEEPVRDEGESSSSRSTDHPTSSFATAQQPHDNPSPWGSFSSPPQQIRAAWETTCLGAPPRIIAFSQPWEGCKVDGREVSWEEMRWSRLEEERSQTNKPYDNRSVHNLNRRGGGDDDDDNGLEKFRLWREIKKQVKLLREGLEDEDSKTPRAPVLFKPRT